MVAILITFVFSGDNDRMLSDTPKRAASYLRCLSLQWNQATKFIVHQASSAHFTQRNHRLFTAPIHRKHHH